MKISRRNFLGGVAGTAAALFSFRPIWAGELERAPELGLDFTLLDLKSQCVLPESLLGYQAALAGAHHRLPEAWADTRYHCRMVIVPGLGHMDSAVAHALLDLVNDGALLLLESGAGFLSPAEFATHRKMLAHYFNLAVEWPVDLWRDRFFDDTIFGHRSGSHSRKKLDVHNFIPYVSYNWPQETKVRDFSRIIPMSSQTGEVIGKVGAVAVALKKRMGKGTLIFLGSPLGPALGVSDTEAKRWIQSVTAL